MGVLENEELQENLKIEIKQRKKIQQREFGRNKNYYQTVQDQIYLEQNKN